MAFIKFLLLIMYVPFKIFVYSWWCYRGFNSLQLNYDKPKLKAFLFGLLRFGVGLMFALVLLLLTMTIYDEKSPIITGMLAYLIVYIPIHWFEWSIVEIVMNKAARKLKFLFVSPNESSTQWRLGGVGLCVLMDIPWILLTKGLPVGNFYLC